MKRICAGLLAGLLLSLAACAQVPGPETTAPTLAPGPEKPTELTEPAQPTDPLSTLRAAMKPPVIAVANLGFPELSEEYEIMDYLLDEYPQWMAQQDYLANIPGERIIRTCGYDAWANLLCIVPRDPDSSVMVRVMQYLDHEPYTREYVVYSSDSGDPILLLADIAEDILVTVEVVDSQGRGVRWWPYWDGYEVIPEEDYSGAHVMNFTPTSEKTSYQRALESGWTVPEDGSLRNHMWQSDWDYRLELYYDPGENFDGGAYIYEYDYSGTDAYDPYIITYQGVWRYHDGTLYLELGDNSGNPLTTQLRILTHPDHYGWLGIYPTEDGVGLPQFHDYSDYDELRPLGTDATSPYENALFQGFRPPTAEELVNTEWVSDCRYALDLLDDGVPGDNAGEATLYDVSADGAYTVSHTGTWQLKEDTLHLLLVPQAGDGVFIDDSFPVLILDETLWLGRNGQGNCLPGFSSDMLADILFQSKG